VAKPQLPDFRVTFIIWGEGLDLQKNNRIGSGDNKTFFTRTIAGIFRDRKV
jgi:hypothetical protein